MMINDLIINLSISSKATTNPHIQNWVSNFSVFLALNYATKSKLPTNDYTNETFGEKFKPLYNRCILLWALSQAKNISKSLETPVQNFEKKWFLKVYS